MQPALGDPASAGVLDQMTHRGPFQPRPFWDSVKEPPFPRSRGSPGLWDYNTISKVTERAPLSSPGRKAAMSAERRGVGSQADKGVSTAALTHVSRLTRGLHRLFFNILDLLVHQSASQIDNFLSRYNTAKE